MAASGAAGRAAAVAAVAAAGAAAGGGAAIRAAGARAPLTAASPAVRRLPGMAAVPGSLDWVKFWKQDEVPYGVFSQWARVAMVDPGTGRRYTTAEQYMMASKAAVFGDAEAEAAILAMTDPRDIKAAGRGVRGFDEAVWDAVKFDVVVRANRLKFMDEAAREVLLSTGERPIVEASPVDRVWGSGPISKADGTWGGENLLGKALMVVRWELRVGRRVDDADDGDGAAGAGGAAGGGVGDDGCGGGSGAAGGGASGEAGAGAAVVTTGGCSSM